MADKRQKTQKTQKTCDLLVERPWLRTVGKTYKNILPGAERE
jgi:hypothetical protein